MKKERQQNGGLEGDIVSIIKAREAAEASLIHGLRIQSGENEKTISDPKVGAVFATSFLIAQGYTLIDHQFMHKKIGTQHSFFKALPETMSKSASSSQYHPFYEYEGLF